MIKSTYKPGEDTYPFTPKNKYYQDNIDSELCSKGYFKNGNFIGYNENYIELSRKGIKYKI